MKHHSSSKRKPRKYQRIAAAFAGAALMSAALFNPVAAAAPPPPEVAAGQPPAAKAAAKQAVGKKVAKGQSVNRHKASASSKQSKQTAAKNALQTLTVTATAYAPGEHDNGPWGNKTYLGTQVRPGIIAVDPDVIPLGSKVYIEFPDGDGVHAVAEDTGGAIKGNRIDIAKWTVDEAYDFGMQKVKVHILSRGDA